MTNSEQLICLPKTVEWFSLLGFYTHSLKSSHYADEKVLKAGASPIVYLLHKETFLLCKIMKCLPDLRLSLFQIIQ